jgi:phosphoribosylformylglycinamidine synthase
VSFYNESDGRPVHPTPVVGVLGLLDDAARAVPSGFPRAGLDVHLLGETRADLGGSAWQRLAAGRLEGRPPSLDLDAEAALQRLLVELASGGLLASAHDCSDGGLAIALVEAVLASGVGATVTLPPVLDDPDLPPLAALVAETPSRVLIAAAPAAAPAIAAAAATAAVPLRQLGQTGGDTLTVPGLLDLDLARLRAAYEGALPGMLD